MPSWGDRVYSPTIDGFRLCVDPSGGDTSEGDGEAPSPSLFGMLRLNAGGGGISSPTPAQLGFKFEALEDPRSTRGNIPLPLTAVGPVTTSPPKKSPNSKSRSKPKLTLPLTASRPAPLPPSSSPPRPIHNKNRPSSIKFADLPLRPHNPTSSLSKSLTTYPRSPYPSAPLGSPTLSPYSPSPVLPRPDDVLVPVSPSDADFMVNGEVEVLRRKVTNLNQGQNQGKNRRALSLDDKKMCRRGMRGARGRGRAQVGQLRLGVPGSTSSGSGPVVKSPIRFVPMPSPLRKGFDFVMEEDEGVSSPVDESGPTATNTLATTGRKNPPPPLSLNAIPAPAFVTTTTTTVTTTTVQITSSPTTHDNTKADIHNTVNTKTNANTNTITYSHTPTSLLPFPPPYSETPLAAEVTLGLTPSASAFGAGFRSGAHHNSESPSHNHTQHIHPCQHEWKGSESARLNMAFWESMSLAGPKVTTNGLKRVDGNSRAMTSSTCDLMREERKEVEEEPAGIVCGRPGTCNSTASWVSVLGEGRGSGNPYDVNVKAGSDSGNCFVDEGICMADRGRPSVGGTAVSSLSESTPDILSRSTSSSSFRRQELSLFPFSARRAQRQQKQEKQKDCSEFDSENGMEGQEELNMVFATRDGVLWSPGLAHRRYRHSPTIIQKQLKGPDDDNRRSISFRAWQHMPREGEDENGCGRKTTSSSPHFIDANSTLVTPIPPPTNPKAKSKSELKSGSGEKPRRARGNLNLRSTESEVEDEYDNDDEEDVGVTVDLKGLKSPGRTNSFASSRRGVERISRGKPGDVRMKTVEAEGTRISRSIVASPSPNDPTAMFPSFSFALSQNQSQSQSQDGQEQLVGLGVVDAVPEEDSIAKMTLGANTGGGGGDVTSNWQREEFAHVGGSFPLPKLAFPPRARLLTVAGDGISSSLQSNYRSNGDERQRV